MAQTPLTLRRWTRAEYDRLVELGVFGGEPLELVDGQLVVAEPQGAYHVAAVGVAADALRAALPSGWTVRIQAPVALDAESEPEPDLAVVPGRPADYRAVHPARPILVVEVAHTSLDFDRRHKGSLYARAGLPDFWIVNLVGGVLEVYRDPVPDAATPYGWAYRNVATLAAPARVAPLALPSSVVSVADLLP